MGDSAATDVLLEQSNKAMQENAALKEKLEKLQAQLAEHKIENLAGLDDIFKIRCEYRVRGYGGKTTNFDRDVQATWREIFIHVAGQLDLPRVASYIDNGIKQLVVEKDPGTEIQSINSTDRITIKTQLEALGLISTSVMNAVDGRMHEYLSLTPAGRLQFLEERSVKKT